MNNLKLIQALQDRSAEWLTRSHRAGSLEGVYGNISHQLSTTWGGIVLGRYTDERAAIQDLMTRLERRAQKAQAEGQVAAADTYRTAKAQASTLL